jgi:hypothetical protein
MENATYVVYACQTMRPVWGHGHSASAGESRRLQDLVRLARCDDSRIVIGVDTAWNVNHVLTSQREGSCDVQHFPSDLPRCAVNASATAPKVEFHQSVMEDAASATDFMAVGYEHIDEPLKLGVKGQRWFTREDATESDTSPALVLGAVGWLAQYAAGRRSSVTIADCSQRMLSIARDSLTDDARRKVQTLVGQWSEIGFASETLGLVLGDNSFSYLPFPQSWDSMCTLLHDQMRSGGRLLARVLSVPTSHRSNQDLGDIAAEFESKALINYTEVRLRALFNVWCPETYQIPCETALQAFESNLPAFASLLARAPSSIPNDLLGIRKYIGSGAVYFAPPLQEVLRIFSGHFRVTHVAFGDYPMSQYFPLIVAMKT